MQNIVLGCILHVERYGIVNDSVDGLLLHVILFLWITMLGLILCVVIFRRSFTVWIAMLGPTYA